jgi:hypothetical protein
MANMRRNHEELLLQDYCSRAGGPYYLEVPVGKHRHGSPWPKGSRVRRIDAVRVTSEGGSLDRGEMKRWDPRSREEFRDAIKTGPVELIEAKIKLNRPVIGQVIAGSEMFEMEYGVSPAERSIVYRVPDPALEIICSKLGIRLHRVS